MLPQENLQPLRLFLVAYEIADNQWSLLASVRYSIDHTHLYTMNF